LSASGFPEQERAGRKVRPFLLARGGKNQLGTPDRARFLNRFPIAPGQIDAILNIYLGLQNICHKPIEAAGKAIITAHQVNHRFTGIQARKN